MHLSLGCCIFAEKIINDMCGIIIVNLGEKEIETPKEFKEHFGFEAPIAEHYKTIDMDACLCQVDVELAFDSHNITFKKDCGDYYVGMLDMVNS